MPRPRPVLPASRTKSGSISGIRHIWYVDEACLVGEAHYEPGGTYGPLEQSMHQLVIVQRGSVEVCASDATRFIRAGEVGLLRPGEKLLLRFSRATACRHTWVSLRLAATDPLAAALNGTRLVGPVTPRLAALIENALSLGNADDTSRSALLRHLMLASLWEYVVSASGDAAVVEGPVLARALATLRRQPEKLTVEGLANATGISRQHLRRLFQRRLQTTPSRYLWQCRVEKAHALLIQTAFTLAEVARLAGFESEFHLSRKLKAAYGRSPRELRRIPARV